MVCETGTIKELSKRGDIGALAALEARVAAGGLAALIVELVDEPGAEARRLSRALAQHRSVLEERPRLVLPCVYQLGGFAADGGDGRRRCGSS